MELREVFLTNNVNLTTEQEKNLKEFEILLKEGNARFNLTSILESYDIYCKHFLDSIIGYPYFGKGKILEIGSGGGFPSVPLKIYDKNLDFTLVESTNKKCNFLREVKNHFNFSNFEIICSRCEDLAKKDNFRESYDFVTARAVASMSTLLEYTIPFLKIGGKFIAYKTNDAKELSDAERVGSILGATLRETISYSLPQGERTIIIMEKISKTPTKYPRGQGKERSKPL